jgi:hypothetical protein
MLGSGLFALTSSQVTSAGNEVRSGTLSTTPPPPTDAHLQATPATSGSCSGVTFTDDTTIAAVFNSDLTPEPGASADAADICVRNNGGTYGLLGVGYEHMVDVENNGPSGCEESEAASTGGNDTSCGGITASDGELEPILDTTIAVAECTPASSDLRGTTRALSDFGSIGIDMGTLAPNQTCRVRISVSVMTSSTQQQRLAAQTDKLQWDIVFRLPNSTP